MKPAVFSRGRKPAGPSARPWAITNGEGGNLGSFGSQAAAEKKAAWFAESKWWANYTGWCLKNRDTGATVALGADGRAMVS